MGGTDLGDAPIKGAHLSGREIGVNIIYLGNPFCTNEKLNGFELLGRRPDMRPESKSVEFFVCT